MTDLFKSLADPTRREIIRMLRKCDLTAGEIAANFPLAKPTLSKHFAVLKKAGLIQGTRSGTTITYTLNLSVLEDALCGMMTAFKIQPRNQGKP